MTEIIQFKLALQKTWCQFIDLELIAYQAPLYQVLSLPGTQGAPQTAPVPPTPAPRSENSAGPVRPWRTCSSRCRAAVIDYETFCKIHDHLDRKHLSIAQTARGFALSAHTIAKSAVDYDVG